MNREDENRAMLNILEQLVQNKKLENAPYDEQVRFVALLYNICEEREEANRASADYAYLADRDLVEDARNMAVMITLTREDLIREYLLTAERFGY